MAQPNPPATARQVQAAYLYQFGRYVEWPYQEPTGGSFLVCVLGTDPFGTALDDIVKGKTISGHTVAAKRIPGPGEMQDCRVLYISHSEEKRLPAILEALAGKTILTVGEGTQFTQHGGMLAFVLADRRVRFVVNQAAAEAAKVKLSSELLRLAAGLER
jgi:hypothetical protein